jgi:hypothetical protein
MTNFIDTFRYGAALKRIATQRLRRELDATFVEPVV